MPQLLSSFHDSRFLASADIQKLTLTPDAKYLVVASNSYPEQKLSIFNAESGELVQDLPVFFKDLSIGKLMGEGTCGDRPRSHSVPRQPL
jgi:hypothetical protein